MTPPPRAMTGCARPSHRAQRPPEDPRGPGGPPRKDHVMASRTPDRRTRRSGLATLAITLAIALGLTACSVSSGDGMDASYVEPGFAPAPDVAFGDRAASDAMAVESMPSAGGATGGEPVSGDVVGGRRIVRNAYLVLEVRDGAAAVDEVGAIATEVGGYVSNTYLSRDDAGVVTGTVVVRVPSERLDEVVDRYDALAIAVPTRSVDEFDVTAQVIDVEAQLTNARAFETELRALLTEARERGGQTSELVAILEQLRYIRAEIQWLEASQKQLTDQVVLSTVTVEVRQAVSGAPLGPGSWRPSDTVREAIAATLRGLTRLVDGAIWLVVTVVPVLAVPVLVLWLAVRWRRARRARRATAASATGSGAGSGPDRASDGA